MRTSLGALEIFLRMLKVRMDHEERTALFMVLCTHLLMQVMEHRVTDHKVTELKQITELQIPNGPTLHKLAMSAADMQTLASMELCNLALLVNPTHAELDTPAELPLQVHV